MRQTRTKLTTGGRIVIPAEFRKALGMHVGEDLVLRLDDGEVRVFTLDEAIRRAQETIGQWFPDERSLADELIAERRAEAARE